LTVLGAPVGRHLSEDKVFGDAGENGSIIAVIATDVPLAPHQLQRVARRGAIGIGRTGTVGGNNSGDIFLAFSVADEPPMAHRARARITMEILNDERLDAVYEAVIQAVEEAILNAMVAADDMGGTRWDQASVRAIEHGALVQVLKRYGRLRG
jgi:L-aminopeptidase/D-esterase-like protein